MQYRNDYKHTWLSLAFAAVLAIATLPLAANAADNGDSNGSGNASKEIATAAKHAGYASEADTVAKVHLHLHHTLNCLVGPKGDAFDKEAGYPCKGMGNGAINDLSGSQSDEKAALKDIKQLAETGVKLKTMEVAQNTADTVESMLEELESD